MGQDKKNDVWFSDTKSEEVRTEYAANVRELLRISRVNNKKLDYQVEGETRIRPGNHFAFSPNATNIAFISVRTADEEIRCV